jgi:hypothetical protein
VNVALVLAIASACTMSAALAGCGEEGSRPAAVPVPPVTSATAPARTAELPVFSAV